MVSRISFLIVKHNQSALADDEQFELDNWISQSEENQRLFFELTDPDHIKAHLKQLQAYDEQSVRTTIEAQFANAFKGETKIKRIWFRVAAAAAVIAFFGSGVYFYWSFEHHKSLTEQKNQLARQDVAAPIKNRATITLANGQKIFLDSVRTGTIATQKNVRINKNSSGAIVYSGNTQPKTELTYNVLTNPRGSRVIDITLNDGTRVWLNAASSLRYPVSFLKEKRNVEITGEAYFEVAHDASRPFSVSKGYTNVEVLGTHFNVNAYEDEPNIKVTLLEGSIKLRNENLSSEEILKPGEQGIVKEHQIEIAKSVNIEEVMAWKNGLFKFDHTDLKVIMREMARWYDVEVSYEGNIPEELYNGDVPRTANASAVLKVLQYTGANFTIERNKIIVRP